jgi:hypothetical protein
MSESPNEAELEIIFERLRQEWLMDMEHLRSEAAIVHRVNQSLKFWPLKNLGGQSKGSLRERAKDRRSQMIIELKRRQRRRRRRVGVRRVQLWTPTQVEMLQSMYPRKHIPVDRIAYRSGRTRKAIYMKAWKLGLKRGG